MPDHRSSDTRIPEWAVVPFWIGVLCALAAFAFAWVAIGIHYATGG
jgi:type VI protein secretion system component VasF